MPTLLAMVLINGAVVTCSELYSKVNTSVTTTELLMKMDNFREVECILGCRSFAGCAFASFDKVDEHKHIGSCSYYASLNVDGGSDTTGVTGYISK